MVVDLGGGMPQVSGCLSGLCEALLAGRFFVIELVERLGRQPVWILDPSVGNVCLEGHDHFAFQVGHFDILAQLASAGLRAYFLSKSNRSTN